MVAISVRYARPATEKQCLSQWHSGGCQEKSIALTGKCGQQKTLQEALDKASNCLEYSIFPLLYHCLD